MAGALLLFNLCLRLAGAAVELWHEGALPAHVGIELPASGLIACGLLIASCAVGIRRRGDARLIPVLFWLFVLGGTWGAFSLPFGVASPPVVSLSVTVLLWALALGSIVCVFVASEGVCMRRWRRRLARTDASALAEPVARWPELAASCRIVGAFLVLLACFSLAVPVELWGWGFRLAPLLLTIVVLSSSAALLSLADRSWDKNTADIGLGLMTLAICSGALCLLPREPEALSVRVPLVLNMLVAALSVSILLWNWLAGVWRQQLADGQAWTTTGRLLGRLWRLTFYTGVLAIVLAGLMVLWPQMPKMPGHDASIGRFTFGVGAHLLLLLAFLRSLRRLRHPSFVLLSVLAVASLIGFITTRAAAFATVLR